MDSKSIIITVHSYKGGTGKSIVAANLAHALSLKGKTALIDSDHLAPCLEAFFKNKGGKKNFLDFLNGDANILDVPQATEYENLYLLPAAPAEIGKDVLSKDKKWHSSALQRLMQGISEMRQNYDYIVIDNQYGVSLASTNNLAVANASILVLRPVSYGMEGTAGALGAIYKKLRHLTTSTKERQDFLLWNQVPEGDKEAVSKALEKWNLKYQENGLQILPMIPYQNEIALDMLLSNNSGIFPASHPFKEVIIEVRDILLAKTI